MSILLSKEATDLLLDLRAGKAAGLIVELVAAGYLVDTGRDLPSEDATARLALICEGHFVSAGRRESLAKAIAAGASDAALIELREAHTTSGGPAETIVIPRGRYEHLSRGKGWARKGRGDDVEWGEKEGKGYRVGPGRWVVGSNDGFNRKDSMDWEVKHVKVGSETWTIAN